MQKTKNNKISLGESNLAILNGSEDVSLWSEEELLRGRRRAKNGQWTGKQPQVVPLQLHQELTRRRLDKAYTLLRDDLVAAVRLLGSIVRDESAENKDRIKAAALIIERVMGKATERVEVKVEGPAPWELALEAMVVSSLDDVVDAELVDEN